MTLASVLRALLGGSLIGLAATIALLGHGRIAGISGTLGRLFDGDGGRGFRVPFVLAMIAIGAIGALLVPHSVGVSIRSTPLLAVAGLLVGVGTTLGNGCTSGHGVCGISRGSARSIIATVVFMLTGAITVALMGAHA